MPTTIEDTTESGVRTIPTVIVPSGTRYYNVELSKETMRNVIQQFINEGDPSPAWIKFLETVYKNIFEKDGVEHIRLLAENADALYEILSVRHMDHDWRNEDVFAVYDALEDAGYEIDSDPTFNEEDPARHGEYPD